MWSIVNDHFAWYTLIPGPAFNHHCLLRYSSFTGCDSLLLPPKVSELKPLKSGRARPTHVISLKSEIPTALIFLLPTLYITVIRIYFPEFKSPSRWVVYFTVQKYRIAPPKRSWDIFVYAIELVNILVKHGLTIHHFLFPRMSGDRVHFSPCRSQANDHALSSRRGCKKHIRRYQCGFIRHFHAIFSRFLGIGRRQLGDTAYYDGLGLQWRAIPPLSAASNFDSSFLLFYLGLRCRRIR